MDSGRPAARRGWWLLVPYYTIGRAVCQGEIHFSFIVSGRSFGPLSHLQRHYTI